MDFQNINALASYVYENYDTVTGFNLEERDNEGEFPQSIINLVEDNGFTMEDFQESWNRMLD